MIKEYKIEISKNSIESLERLNHQINNIKNLITFMLANDMQYLPQFNKYHEEYEVLLKEFNLAKNCFLNFIEKDLLKENQELLNWSVDFGTDILIYIVKED